jgi:hypothetical protein
MRSSAEPRTSGRAETPARRAVYGLGADLKRRRDRVGLRTAERSYEWRYRYDGYGGPGRWSGVSRQEMRLTPVLHWFERLDE